MRHSTVEVLSQDSLIANRINHGEIAETLITVSTNLFFFFCYFQNKKARGEPMPTFLL